MVYKLEFYIIFAGLHIGNQITLDYGFFTVALLW